MSHGRCVRVCEGELPLFALPERDSLREQWLRFINPDIHLCSVHFTEDCLAIRAADEAGVSARLILENGAVPTLLGRVDPDSRPTLTLRYRPVECQTVLPPEAPVGTLTIKVPPQTVSVGTQTSEVPPQSVSGSQLSTGTQREPFRSEVFRRSAGPETSSEDTNLQLSTSTSGETSAPLKSCRPAKRRRLNLLEEDEDPVS